MDGWAAKRGEVLISIILHNIYSDPRCILQWFYDITVRTLHVDFVHGRVVVN